MPSLTKQSIFTAADVAAMKSTARKIQDALDLCERAGNCGMPNAAEMMAELEGMKSYLQAIVDNFVTGQKLAPAKTVSSNGKAGNAK